MKPPFLQRSRLSRPTNQSGEGIIRVTRESLTIYIQQPLGRWDDLSDKSHCYHFHHDHLMAGPGVIAVNKEGGGG